MKNLTRLFDLPYYQLDKYPLEKVFSDKKNGQWSGISTQEYIDNFNAVSRGFINMGVKAGDKIAIISNNRSEWHVIDMAIQQVGAIGVPVYPTISQDDYVYIFNDAGVSLCFVSDEELLEKVKGIKDQVSTLKDIYTFNQINGAKHWTELKHEENADFMTEIENRKSAIQPDDLVTLIYTSGTTGRPKGVMLSHNNLLSNVVSCAPRVPVVYGDKSLSFLPVCHVYERMLLYLYQYLGISVYFAESIDTISDNLNEIKPEVFTAVPRLIEKVYDKIVATGEALSGVKHKLFFWALHLGHHYELEGTSAIYNFKLKIARKLIFSKWQEALGGNVKAIVSGSAALQPRLARTFTAAGIPVFEGYGLTETSPVISVNYLGDNNMMFGTTGSVIDKVDVKFDEDGEILVKGPNVMKGYYNQPEKTAEVFTEDGYFRTGDIGVLEKGRFLKITDRKKEMFKTSGGKYVAPQPMENKFKESRFIEQIMVIGDGRKHPAALIVPAFDFFKQWCSYKGHECTDSREDMIKNPHLIQKMNEEVEYYNQNFGKWEQIKKFELVANEWTVENGELTPTLKPKRKVMNEKYKDLIEKIYS